MLLFSVKQTFLVGDENQGLVPSVCLINKAQKSRIALSEKSPTRLCILFKIHAKSSNSTYVSFVIINIPIFFLTSVSIRKNQVSTVLVDITGIPVPFLAVLDFWNLQNEFLTHIDSIFKAHF